MNTTSNTTGRTHGANGSYADDDPKKRPGVPAERNPPAPVGNAHWITPPKQTMQGNELKDAGRPEMTATFGTDQAPRGMSGWMRARAYRIPDYRIRRWVLLMLADRVDRFEGLFRLRASA